MDSMPPSSAFQRTAEIERLYREYYPRIVRLIAARFGPQIAEDVASKVFEKLLCGRWPKDGRTTWPWLRRVAMNQAIDHLRTNRRHEPIDAVLDLPRSRDEADDTVRRVVVQTALGGLEPIERDAVVAAAGGMPAAVIAKRYGRSEQAVHTVASRTRKRLRAMLASIMGLAAASGKIRRFAERIPAGGAQALEFAALAIAISTGAALELPGSEEAAATPFGSAAAVQVAAVSTLAGSSDFTRAPRMRVVSDELPGRTTGVVIELEREEDAPAPRSLVVERPRVPTPLGPVGGGRTEVSCSSPGFEVLPETDGLRRIC